MLITKFNKMIRNKTLWWFFAIVVSVTFVWAYSDASDASGGCSNSTPDAVGKIFGKEITRQALDRAMFYTMRMQNFRNQTTDNMRIIRHEAWKRLAALETADQLGISATVNELISAIGNDPTFQADGAFNKEKYKAVIESQMQVPVQQFEDFLREEIILQKLGSLMESCVWTSPVELNQRLTRITDQISIRHAIFKMNTNAPAITISEDDARKYFEKNIEQFRVPDMLSVKYIKFPASAYQDKVQVSESEIKNYYTNNMDKFAVSETNSTATKPLEEVKQEIHATLQKDKALTEANDHASRFVTSLIPDQKGRAPSFADAASRTSLSIYTSKFFSVRGTVPDMDVDRNFNRTAFDLDPEDKERYFSDPVSCGDTVYVLAAHDRQKSHLPYFSNVVSEATSMAQREADEEAFAKKCNIARDNAMKNLKTPQDFEDAMKKSGATVSTNISFSAYEAASDPFEYFDVILPKVMHMSKGDVTEPLEIEEGMIVVYVADKEPGKPGAAESVKPEMISAIDRSLTVAVYNDWKEYLLQKSGFIDRMPPISASENTEPAE